MRVLHIQKYGRSPILTTCSKPKRNIGQVLIKMHYAPINPSDLNFYTGLYGVKKEGFPIMGFQGSGVVVESDNQEQIGKQVSVLANMSNGTYAQFLSSKYEQCIFWPSQTAIQSEYLSMFSINPLSVIGLCQIALSRNSKSIILSAATSNVSKMLVSYLKLISREIKIYGISRSSQYDGQLKTLGFDELYRPDQIETIKLRLMNDDNSVFYDCVGGNFAGTIFNILPKNSIMVNYGRLSKEQLGSIDLGELYFKNKQIRGFWLNTYLKSITSSQLQKDKQEIIKNYKIFKQNIRKIYQMEQFIEASRQSIKNTSSGKILLKLF